MDWAISWVDLVLAGLLAASVLLGLWRGLMFELLAIAGWIVAYFGCPYLAPIVGGWLPAERLGPNLVHLAGLVLAFILILIIWGLAAKLLRALLRATPLSGIDRLLGAGFGVLRGLLVCLLLVVVVSMTPAVASPTWAASQLAPWLQELLLGLRPVLPDAVVKLIPAEADRKPGLM
ncbi:CvpA family protein [Roseateles violae]|uniref:CvpA family protein n=1 Tax=Roseateles violae TaxID=3058042 RepID=A0ABT8DXU2_9BURK|nr:CvpA family protein [Pelomonas sp. PFR6]MDN3921749.1 CvpA family protein [Pelomonas sp. PFR6]